MIRPPPSSPLFPYPPLFRSESFDFFVHPADGLNITLLVDRASHRNVLSQRQSGKRRRQRIDLRRSEEHTSELQSHLNLVCRLLLEKKKKIKKTDACS